jgi:hypothetical protein
MSVQCNNMSEASPRHVAFKGCTTNMLRNVSTPGLADHNAESSVASGGNSERRHTYHTLSASHIIYSAFVKSLTRQLSYQLFRVLSGIVEA